MQRREFAKTVGGIAGLTTVGAGGLLAASGGAAATNETQITEEPVMATSDDGRIKWVAVQTTGRLEWDGFDTAAKHAQMIISIELWQDGETVYTGQLHDTGVRALDNESWGGSGEEVSLGGDNEDGQSGYLASDADWGVAQRNQEHYYDPSAEDNTAEDGNGYGLPATPAPTSYFTANEDGDSRATRVVLKSEYRLFDANEDELTGTSGYPDRPESTGEFTVTVENEKSSTSFSETDGDGDSESDATVGV